MNCFGGNNFSWIIIIILLLICCGGCGNNSCGCRLQQQLRL